MFQWGCDGAHDDVAPLVYSGVDVRLFRGTFVMAEDFRTLYRTEEDYTDDD
jgi:hypothetical protein